MNAGPRSRRQQGMALLIALVVLIVVSILGATAMRSALMQSRISVNGQMNNMMFEGAESGLRAIETYSLNQLNGVAPFSLAALTSPNHIFYKATNDGIPQRVCLQANGSITPASLDQQVTVTPNGDDWNVVYTACPQRTGSPVIVTAIVARPSAGSLATQQQATQLCGNQGASTCPQMVYTQAFASIAGLSATPHSHVQLLSFVKAANGNNMQ